MRANGPPTFIGTQKCDSPCWRILSVCRATTRSNCDATISRMPCRRTIPRGAAEWSAALLAMTCTHPLRVRFPANFRSKPDDVKRLVWRCDARLGAMGDPARILLLLECDRGSQWVVHQF